MLAPRSLVIVALVALSAVCVLAQQGSLTDNQVATAIRVGQQGKDLTVLVGMISGRHTSCGVIVQGPVARVSAAAAEAFREERPFTADNVTSDMKAATYHVTLRSCMPAHIVLKPADSSGTDGVIQPIHESASGAIFDRLPNGPFDVVVVVAGDARRVPVSAKDRARIETPLLGMPETAPAPSMPPPVMPPAPPPAIPKPASKLVRLFVQGDGKDLTDALGSLQAELATAGITATVAQRGEPYDYVIIFGQGDRHAAAAIALDTRGDVVASAVRGASFTDKGAADDVGRDLGKQLAALSR